jgi:flagellar protein FlaI
MAVETKIDEMIRLILKEGWANYQQIAREFVWSEQSVEKMALILEKAGMAKTHYPVNMMEDPWISVSAVQPLEERTVVSGKQMDAYEISAKEGHTRGAVSIVYSEEEKRPVYNITLPEVSPYTRAYLEAVKIEVSRKMPMAADETVESMDQFLLRHHMISDLITRDLSPDADALDRLTDVVLNEMYGLGELEVLIGDTRLEEIVINSVATPVSVYHKRYGWLKTNIFMKSEEETRNYAEQIARRVGRQISILTPILDAHLKSGDRANATLAPISAGNTLTMRLFARNPWTIVSYLKKENNALSLEMAALLWQAMQYEMNVLIAGGTASGKTSALNGLLALIQPFQRIITIEDTRELMLPTYQWNWIPMVTRPANPEGLGEVSMLDLVVNALRMRPDRLIMGEIRRKSEAEVLFEAMHTGHSVYSTVHADTGAQVIKRLIEPPIEVPAAEIEDIHLLVVQYRDRRKNVRRTLEISEVVPSVGEPDLNRLFNWMPRTDTFQKVKPAHRYTEQMNLHTGMTEKEVEDDQHDKMAILQWLVSNGLEDIDAVGHIMQLYYADEASILKAATGNTPPSKVL